jgi:hypothetical protein
MNQSERSLERARERHREKEREIESEKRGGSVHVCYNRCDDGDAYICGKRRELEMWFLVVLKRELQP